MKVEIITQPYSGEFRERIYDVQSPWNSQSWTWIKFTEENESVTVGQFRGSPKKVKVSNQRKEIFVLTSDYAFRLNASNLNVIETEDQPQYANLEVSPNGTFIVSEYSNICKMTDSFRNMDLIESPFEMDLIKFKDWDGTMLLFECEEMGRWGQTYVMALDAKTWTIISIASKNEKHDSN